MKFNFDKPINRKNTDCFKWDYLNEVFGKNDILPMWVADMDFPAPAKVTEILQTRAAHGVFGYTITPDSYYNSIISWLKKRFNWKIKKKWIVNTPGIVPAINIAIQTFTKKDDKILVQTPVYYPFFLSIQNNQRKIVNSKLKLIDDHYQMDFLDLEKKFAKGVKMMLLCSPHNPVSRVWKKTELEKLADLCLKYNVLLISDEIHADIIFSKYEHFPIAKFEKIKNQIITMNSPSKTFNIAGLYTSYLVIESENLRRAFQNSLEKLWLLHGNLFGIEALKAAYLFGEDWLEELLKYLEANYLFVKEFLENYLPAIKAIKMEGTFLSWLDCRKLDLKQKELVKLFVEKAKLGLSSGKDFGSGGEGFMRMNIGCPRSYLAEAMRRLQKTVKEI